ncbi:MAG: phosphoenolpyruvate carboxykinase domain-containing protein, partial [Clostridia bacterium]
NRCEDKVGAKETAIGYVPNAEDINLEGIESEVSKEQLADLLTVTAELWNDDVAGLEEFYAKFDRMPKEMTNQLNALKERLSK